MHMNGVNGAYGPKQGQPTPRRHGRQLQLLLALLGGVIITAYVVTLQNQVQVCWCAAPIEFALACRSMQIGCPAAPQGW